MSKKYTLTSSKSLSTTGNTSQGLYVYLSNFSPTLNIPQNEFLFYATAQYLHQCAASNILVTNGGSTSIMRTNGTEREIIRSWDAVYKDSLRTVYDNITNYLDDNYKFNYLYYYFKSTSAGNTTKNIKDIKLIYITLPYKLILKSVEGGAYSRGHVEGIDTAISLKAVPKDGYKFSKWSNGRTEQEIIFDPGQEAIGTEIELYAIYEPITYTVNYNIIKEDGTIELWDSQKCEYNKTYNYLPKPDNIFPEIPIHYKENSIGWIDTINYTSCYIQTDNTMIYSLSSNPTTVKQYVYNSEFLNLTKSDNAILNRYYGFFKIAYKVKYLEYKNFKYYTIDTTEYREAGKSYNLRKFSSLIDGYKLTNRMSQLGGPEDETITNAWFISDINLNPGDPKITSISSEMNEDISVYSNIVPIDYTIIFHGIDENGQEIKTFEYKGQYNTSGERPNLLEDKEYYKISDWYKYSKSKYEVQSWYVDPTSLSLINVPTANYSKTESISSSYTYEDQSVCNEYIYYIPYGYNVNYSWLDDLGPESQFQLKNEIRRYGTRYLINIIPSYSGSYEVENANTRKWYYYNENNELVQNENKYIEADTIGDYNFYGRKSSLPKKISIVSNNLKYGIVRPISPNAEMWFEEDYGFYTYANEKDILIFGNTVDSNVAYFDQWSDQNSESTREIAVSGKAEQEYKAIFRSNKIFVNKKGVQGVYQNTQQIQPNIVVGIPT